MSSSNQQVSSSSSSSSSSSGVSSQLITFGVNRIKKNPIKSSFYLLGLIVCLFINGYSVSTAEYEKFDNIVAGIDYEALSKAEARMLQAERQYYSSQGFFWSCDSKCQLKKDIYNEKKADFIKISKDIRQRENTAKGYLGIFSDHAVSEARTLFWKRFNQGKEAATRQSKWDALFMGLSAMSKDESLVEWMLRVFLALLMNFTVGIFIAAVVFIYNLYDLISSYNPSTIAAFTFFVLASSAAISFVLSFLIAIYVTATGAVIGVAAIASTNPRLENRRDGYHRIRRQD